MKRTIAEQLSVKHILDGNAWLIPHMDSGKATVRKSFGKVRFEWKDGSAIVWRRTIHGRMTWDIGVHNDWLTDPEVIAAIKAAVWFNDAAYCWPSYVDGLDKKHMRPQEAK